ncbi:related to protein LDB19 [Cephalotrichum gorgonifer]|uniref:Related to protein LDB19 n=1 Tax=Cephalotrichum gorgonifer TaxID=2041049 RepID=A0AAE8N176_9PEZI|nr:related to protein LDB19 [Cephalotrichum gorgonifer]
MPHFVRVANLFRSSTENHHPSPVKNAIFSTTSNSLDRVSTSTSEESYRDGEEVGSNAPHSETSSLAKMSKGARKKAARLPFSLPWPGKQGRDPGPGSLDCVIDSPPIVFHDTAARSTGALVNGHLVLEVTDELVEVANLEATIFIKVVQKKPFMGHCEECGVQEQELMRWGFLTQTELLTKGTYTYHFSHLLDGSNPISTDTPIVSISYHVKAEAILARQPFTPGSSVTPLRLDMPLPVSRCVPVPEDPHSSIRVFPPTDIRASVKYKQVLTPANKNNMEVVLQGVTSQPKGENVIESWKLKKATWRIEETVRSVARACQKHQFVSNNQEINQDPSQYPRNREVRTEMRVVGEGSVSRQWKADYSGTTGQINMDFDFGLHESRPHHHHHMSAPSRYACDVSSTTSSSTPSPAGCEVTVSHSLMLELVVSQARAPVGRPEATIETGTGRILRMRFRVFVSELETGVSWDEEAPPLYWDVPPRPPVYDDEEGAGDNVSFCESEEGAGGETIYASRSSADGHGHYSSRSIADSGSRPASAGRSEDS